MLICQKDEDTEVNDFKSFSQLVYGWNMRYVNYFQSSSHILQLATSQCQSVLDLLTSE